MRIVAKTTFDININHIDYVQYRDAEIEIAFNSGNTLIIYQSDIHKKYLSIVRTVIAINAIVIERNNCVTISNDYKQQTEEDVYENCKIYTEVKYHPINGTYKAKHIVTEDSFEKITNTWIHFVEAFKQQINFK